MTSTDVHDVLDLPRADAGAGPRPAKKLKTFAPRPNVKGLARELQNLGGDNPIAIVPQVSVFKKRRLVSRKPAARWEMRAFQNSARDDKGRLILRHWRRKPDLEVDRADGDGDADPGTNANTNGNEVGDGDAADDDDESRMHVQNGDTNLVAPEKNEDSTFSKYNAQVVVPEYGEDQYSSVLQSDEWTKDETDYLLALVKDYDLRWPIIWDRYEYTSPIPDDEAMDDTSTAVAPPPPTTRTMEDLKARYYDVAAKMMSVQKNPQWMTASEYGLHEIMANFNAHQEKVRKQFVLNSMARSKDEFREEESLLLEIKRILARAERFNEERRELYNRLDFPHTDQDINSFRSSAGLQNLLQTLMSVDKSKKRKSLMGADGPNSAGGHVGSGGPDGPGNRRESIAASMSGHRDSLGGLATPAHDASFAPPASSNKKKGQPAQERRKLTDQEEQVYGVSHHDRLGSGPTFRYEKVNKLFSHKSNSHALRINNTLNELDVPGRLAMPTAAVTQQFEHLVGSLNTLLETRKTADKLDAEIKIEEAKAAEREKARIMAAGGPAARALVMAAQFDGAGDEKPSGTTAESSKVAEDVDKAGAEEAASDSAAGTSAAAAVPIAGGDADDADEATQSAEAVDSQAEAPRPQPGTHLQVKVEDSDKGKGSRPGSSGAHKRSASVLSATSDKSAKRMKKGLSDVTLANAMGT